MLSQTELDLIKKIINLYSQDLSKETHVEKMRAIGDLNKRGLAQSGYRSTLLSEIEIKSSKKFGDIVLNAFKEVMKLNVEMIDLEKDKELIEKAINELINPYQKTLNSAEGISNAEFHVGEVIKEIKVKLELFFMELRNLKQKKSKVDSSADKVVSEKASLSKAIVGETDFELFVAKKILISLQKENPTLLDVKEFGAEEIFLRLLEVLDRFIKNGFFEIGKAFFGWIPRKAIEQVNKEFPRYQNPGQFPLKENSNEIIGKRVEAFKNYFNRWDTARDIEEIKWKAQTEAFGHKYSLSYCFIYEERDYVFDGNTKLKSYEIHDLKLKILGLSQEKIENYINPVIDDFISDEWLVSNKEKKVPGYEVQKAHLLKIFFKIRDKFQYKTNTYSFHLRDSEFVMADNKGEWFEGLRTLLSIEKEGFIKILNLERDENGFSAKVKLELNIGTDVKSEKISPKKVKMIHLNELQLTEPERLWLTEIYKNGGVPDEKKFLVSLHDRLPEGFDYKKLNRCFLWDNRLNVFGIWLINKHDKIFEKIDLVIRTIKTEIENEPKLEKINATKISELTGLSLEESKETLGYLGQHHNFWSGGHRTGGDFGWDEISFSGADHIPTYLGYKDIQTLLEKTWEMFRQDLYIRPEQTKENLIIDTGKVLKRLNEDAGKFPIFVGSTYEDLKEYRESAREALTELDTKFHGMEFFGAKPDSPLEECLKIVRGCRAYIGIFSMRYGSIPAGHEKSMTHYEYEEAQKSGLPSLIYLIDEENQPVLPKHVELGEGGEKLKKLKKILKDTHMVSFFTTPKDLEQKILQDVPELLNNPDTHKRRKPNNKKTLLIPDAPQEKLELQPLGYYIETPSGRKICGLCWEKDKQKITLLPSKRNGPAMATSSFVTGRKSRGYSSWTEFLICPNCKTEYGHEHKHKTF